MTFTVEDGKPKGEVKKKEINACQESENHPLIQASQRRVQETQLPDKIHYKPNEIQNVDDPNHQQKQENQENSTTAAESKPELKMTAACSGQKSFITRNPSKIEALFLYFYSHQVVHTVQFTPLTSARLHESVSSSK